MISSLNNIPNFVLGVVAAVIGTLGIYLIIWIRKPNATAQTVDIVAKELLANPNTQIRNGYGEFVVFHHHPDKSKTPLSKEEFKQAYTILNEHAPDKMKSEAYANRDVQIRARLREKISQDCDIAFIPRTLYELILIRKGLEEESRDPQKICGVKTLNKDILLNMDAVQITEDEIRFTVFGNTTDRKVVKKAIKDSKCWHRCYFDDWGIINIRMLSRWRIRSIKKSSKIHSFKW